MENIFISITDREFVENCTKHGFNGGRDTPDNIEELVATETRITLAKVEQPQPHVKCESRERVTIHNNGDFKKQAWITREGEDIELHTSAKILKKVDCTHIGEDYYQSTSGHVDHCGYMLVVEVPCGRMYITASTDSWNCHIETHTRACTALESDNFRGYEAEEYLNKMVKVEDEERKKKFNNPQPQSARLDTQPR